ncbi:DUF6368 family protein [Deinococcus roseus]|nr:DUF6368 family protein [Deinococcus roseus]
MGGPDIRILLSQSLTSTFQDELKTLCIELGGEMRRYPHGFSFNVQTLRPLGMDWPFEPDAYPPVSVSVEDLEEMNESTYEQYSSDEVEQIVQIAGFSPITVLDLGAHSNGLISHYVLGALSLYLATKYQGLIDLMGILNDRSFTVWKQLSKEAEVQQAIKMYEAYFLGHAGHLWSVTSEGSEGPWFGHYCDAEFMAWWLKQSEFYLVK